MNTIESSALSGDQLRARIAWYYFVAGLTQQEISDRLGIARARVNKIAGQLRTDGSVVIDIRLPLASCGSQSADRRPVAHIGRRRG